MTGLLFGLAPAIDAVWEKVSETLKLNAPGTSFGRSGFGLRGGLVAVQVALSMVLLVLGGLFVRTLQNLKHQDLGFRAANVLSVQFETQGKYLPAWPNLIAELLGRANAIPGVRAACVSFDGAVGNGGGITGFRFEGSPASTGEEQRAGATWVSPGYFETLGISLLEGREFSLSDNANSPPVVIVNRAMARQYTGSDHALGRRLLLNGKSYEIIGVAKNAKHGDLRESTQRFAYFSALQSGSEIHSLEVRTTVSPLVVAGEIRRVVRSIDPGLRILDIATLEQRIDQKLDKEKLVDDLAGFFAGLTLMLVVLGAYGTVSYSTARRRKEIGIRIAVGARPADITWMVLRQFVVAIAIGLIPGIAVAMIAGKLLTFLLFGLTSTDAATIAGAGLILCLAALTAGYLPVRRACRLDPTIALRLE